MAAERPDPPGNRASGWVSPLDFTTLQEPGGMRVGHRERDGRRSFAVKDKTVEVSPTIMRRKRRLEETENHDRWLVSYADFVTLLFAFFVVMYAISSVNEGKYRVLSDALVVAFRSSARSLAPIQVGDLARSPAMSDVTQTEGQRRQDHAIRPDLSANQNPAEQVPADVLGQKALDSISEQIEKELADLVQKDLISIRRDKLWLEVEIKTSILFSSGSAELEKTALPILGELAGILKGFPNPIQVEGFTDDVPIRSDIYPSNWELSAGRAASVVHLLSKEGVKPERMAAIGYGEYRPIVSNATPEGRNKNRRVVLQILAQADARRVIGIEQGAAKTH